MNDFVLHIFPAGSLDSSVITTVWIGVLVLSFFTLRLGWVASGLVVPGYVVPILLIKPWAGVAIFLESFVTYFLVWFISEVLSRRGKWSSLFGRDRFFAFLLVSVIVRVLFDGWLLPWIGEYLNNRFALAFDYRNNLHSFGIIIVALIANQFWKSGFFKGLTPLFVTMSVTYVIIRFILMEYTNFTISNLNYMYEDIATSILASPKAYIILLTTAFIASRMNLIYGWEFNGILIPSLVTLMWYHPTKILTTFTESIIILLLSVAVLRLPFFKSMTIEGMRKIVLFFSIGYAYKFILGYLMLFVAPEYKVTDFYGFGYLLPTLIAIKMHDTEAVARTARVTLETSLASLAVASLLGFVLTFMPALFPEKVISGEESRLTMEHVAGTTLVTQMKKEKISLYSGSRTQSFIQPTTEELEAFTAGIGVLLEYVEKQDAALLAKAMALLDAAQYRVRLFEERYFLITEKSVSRGWGIYVIDGKTKGRLLVEIPAPLDEQGVMDAGLWIFKALQGKSLAFAGSARKANMDGSADALTNFNTFFQRFHKEMSRWDVLQVRGYTSETARRLSGQRSDPNRTDIPRIESTIWVKNRLPEGLDLALLKKILGTYRIEWGNTPFPNIQRESISRGFAELILNKDDIRALIFRQLLPEYGEKITIAQQRIDGYLQDWLLKSKGVIADRGSNVYKAPKIEELLFLDNEVFTPLLTVAEKGYESGQLTAAASNEIRAADAAASALGYRVIRYRHKATGNEYFIVAEDEAAKQRRYWGTYVIRMGTANQYIIQIARPISELNTFEYGVSLFENIRARALLIAGAHPLANTDRSADVIKVDNKENLFNLVNQVILRQHTTEPFLVVQSRAFAFRQGIPFPQVDVLLAFDSGITNPNKLSTLGRGIVEALSAQGLAWRFVDGAPDVQGYEVGGIPQALYLNQTEKKEFLALWLSPLARKTYQQQTENRPQDDQFRSLAISTIERDMNEFLGQSRIGESSTLPPALRSDLASYLKSHDVVILQSLIDRYPGFRFQRLIDINTKQSFLLVYNPSSELALIVNLFPRARDKSLIIGIRQPGAENGSSFINSGATFLEFRRGS